VKAKAETIIQITIYSKIWKDHVSGMSENRGAKTARNHKSTAC